MSVYWEIILSSIIVYPYTLHSRSISGSWSRLYTCTPCIVDPLEVHGRVCIPHTYGSVMVNSIICSFGKIWSMYA